MDGTDRGIEERGGEFARQIQDCLPDGRDPHAAVLRAAEDCRHAARYRYPCMGALADLCCSIPHGLVHALLHEARMAAYSRARWHVVIQHAVIHVGERLKVMGYIQSS